MANKVRPLFLCNNSILNTNLKVIKNNYKAITYCLKFDSKPKCRYLVVHHLNDRFNNNIVYVEEN